MLKCLIFPMLFLEMSCSEFIEMPQDVDDMAIDTDLMVKIDKNDIRKTKDIFVKVDVIKVPGNLR